MMNCSGCKSVAIIDGSSHCAAPTCPRHIEHMDEAKQQLTAEREARQKAEEDVKKFMALSKANEQLVEIAQHRADRAEARIKASQEQAHFAHFIMHNGCATQISNDAIGLENIEPFPLYAQPLIPPELSEVVRERDELRRKWQSSRQMWNDTNG